jgi:hypothetical protein
MYLRILLVEATSEHLVLLDDVEVYRERYGGVGIVHMQEGRQLRVGVVVEGCHGCTPDDEDFTVKAVRVARSETVCVEGSCVLPVTGDDAFVDDGQELAALGRLARLNVPMGATVSFFCDASSMSGLNRWCLPPGDDAYRAQSLDPLPPSDSPLEMALRGDPPPPLVLPWVAWISIGSDPPRIRFE